MKKSIAALATLVFLSLSSQAYTYDFTNKLRQKREDAAYRAKLEEIPIYREKLTGNYQLLGPVRGQDAFSKSKKAIMLQMREQAYKMGGDAIMEFQCETLVKRTFQQCEGFAIRLQK
jgi:hypothetical protein